MTGVMVVWMAAAVGRRNRETWLWTSDTFCWRPWCLQMLSHLFTWWMEHFEPGIDTISIKMQGFELKSFQFHIYLQEKLFACKY